MQEPKIFTGSTAQEIWQQLKADMEKAPDVFEYRALLVQGDSEVVLDIDIDPGGGFDSGYAATSFTAPVKAAGNFRFSLHKEGLLDEAGKLFGMQDVVIGHPEFDKKVIVKTNDEARVKTVFAEEAIRQPFSTLDDFTLALEEEDHQKILRLTIEDAVTDAGTLQQLYIAFYQLLTAVNAVA